MVVGTLGSRVLTGAAEEEAEVEEGRIEEEMAAEEETAVSFHMLEVEGSIDADVLTDGALEVALTLMAVDCGTPDSLVRVHRIEVESEAISLGLALASALAEVDCGAPDALVLVHRTEEVSSDADADELAMLEGGAEASVRESEYEDEGPASAADIDEAEEVAVASGADTEEMLESVTAADAADDESEAESEEVDEAVALA